MLPRARGGNSLATLPTLLLSPRLPLGSFQGLVLLLQSQQLCKFSENWLQTYTATSSLGIIKTLSSPPRPPSHMARVFGSAGWLAQCLGSLGAPPSHRQRHSHDRSASHSHSHRHKRRHRHKHRHTHARRTHTDPSAGVGVEGEIGEGRGACRQQRKPESRSNVARPERSHHVSLACLLVTPDVISAGRQIG